MKYRQLPGTDITASALAFGCWGLVPDVVWGPRDEAESAAVIHAALDAGINFFDTAAMYGDGSSETVLGKVLGADRGRAVVATKVRPDAMHPDQIPISCEASLRRLGTDYIDLYQTHWTDPDVPAAESWAAMQQLKAQGKVRAVGVCNMGPRDLEDIDPLGRPPTNQVPYNLLWRAIEREVLPACREARIGVLAYSPVMHGLLSGKYRSIAEVPRAAARSRHFHNDRGPGRHGEPGCEEETFAAIDALDTICRDLGRPMAEVALAWVAAQPEITAVITGVSSPAQLAKNIRSLERPLSPEAVRALREATEDLDRALGPNPDMWQGAADSRYR